MTFTPSRVTFTRPGATKPVAVDINPRQSAFQTAGSIALAACLRKVCADCTSAATDRLRARRKTTGTRGHSPPPAGKPGWTGSNRRHPAQRARQRNPRRCVSFPVAVAISVLTVSNMAAETAGVGSQKGKRAFDTNYGEFNLKNRDDLQSPASTQRTQRTRRFAEKIRPKLCASPRSPRSLR